MNTVPLLAARYGLTLGKKGDWWLLSEPILGQVSGLPNSRGILVAACTTGMGIVISSADRAEFYHRDWFIADEPEKQEKVKAKSSGLVKVSDLALLLE